MPTLKNYNVLSDRQDMYKLMTKLLRAMYYPDNNQSGNESQKRAGANIKSVVWFR